MHRGWVPSACGDQSVQAPINGKTIEFSGTHAISVPTCRAFGVARQPYGRAVRSYLSIFTPTVYATTRTPRLDLPGRFRQTLRSSGTICDHREFRGLQQIHMYDWGVCAHDVRLAQTSILRGLIVERAFESPCTCCIASSDSSIARMAIP